MRKILLGRIIPLAVCILIFSALLTSQVKIRITPGYQKQESFQIQTLLVDWTDTGRRGEIPVKIYYPVARYRQLTAFPVIIFSHDAGRTRDEFDYLGQHWASRGYVSVFLPQYAKDYGVWKGSFIQEKDKRYITSRIKERRQDIRRDNDVRFAIDRLEMMNRNDRTFRGMFDLRYIGVVGDYYDANTAMSVAGLYAGVSRDRNKYYSGNPQVRAIIVLSEPAQNRNAILNNTYSRIGVPILEMTETITGIPAQRRGRRPDQKVMPYNFSTERDIYSIIFNVADYMIFSGDRHRNFGKDKMDAYHISFIKDVTTAFWDAYLKNDLQAKQWLRNGRFENYYDGYDMYYKR
jgi:hypothetical protein